MILALGIAGRDQGMGHARLAEKLLEVLGDELRPVVADDPRRLAGELLARALHDDFRFRRGHPRADFPMHDEAAVAVEDRAQVVERAADVQVAEVDVPLVVRAGGLVEALAFAGIRRRRPADPPPPPSARGRPWAD